MTLRCGRAVLPPFLSFEVTLFGNPGKMHVVQEIPTYDIATKPNANKSHEELLDELAEPQKRRFATIISEHIEAARAAADEFTSG